MRRRAYCFDLYDESPIEILRKRFGEVDILSPSQTKQGFGWFVQVRRSSGDEFPIGAFGKTAQHAAIRLVAITHLWDRDDSGSQAAISVNKRHIPLP